MNHIVNQFPEGQIIGMALVFMRVVAFVVAWPIFGVGSVPVSVKVLFSVLLTMLLFPVAKFQNVELVTINDQLVLLVIREISIGLFLGFLLRMFFFTISVAGEIMGISSGLASASLFNPMIGAQTNVLEQVHVVLATLFFLSMNGHHLFLQGIAQSFEIAPVAAVGIKYEAFSSIAMMVPEIMLMGLKMASPIVVAVFIANLTMGLLGRAVPQLNVMMTSFQVTICVSFVVMFVVLPLFVDELGGLMQVMAERFFTAVKVI